MRISVASYVIVARVLLFLEELLQARFVEKCLKTLLFVDFDFDGFASIGLSSGRLGRLRSGHESEIGLDYCGRSLNHCRHDFRFFDRCRNLSQIDDQ